MKLAVAAVGALLTVVVLGCGGSDEADPASIEDVPWVLSSGVDVDGWEAVAPSLRFEAGQFGGSTGCNRYGGSYTADGDTLELGEIASTLMACPPPADAVEREYTAALERVARWRTEDDELVLLDEDESELLRFAQASPVGSWEVTSFARGDASASPLAGTTITATFAEDGGLSGSAGCNTYTSSYELDRGAIEIAPAATTRKFCAEPAGVMEQEAAYVAALAEAARFAVSGGSLELLRADGTGVVSYRRAG